jgi:3',5'-cyclic AMP phosphodiesterase CpdA/energy-coupling factor transporter ATP-binding protein EcfA2
VSVEVRTMSLGRPGEDHWAAVSASLRLSPGRLRALVLADKADVRDEIRRRLAALAGRVHRLEPALAVLTRIHAIAAAEGDAAPLVWIEARPAPLASHPGSAPAGFARLRLRAGTDLEVAEREWLEALRALNRGRDLIADHGEVSVVLAGPHWLHELVQRHAPDLSSVLDATLPLDDTLEPLPEVGGPLCWMHLSDLHVLQENWEQDIVLGALLRDLPGLLEAIDRRPQLLFVTGDLAARAKKEEYDGVTELLARLCELLGLERSAVFMVPGNHDVERGRISSAAIRDHQALLKLEPSRLHTQVGELIGDADTFRVLYGKRLAEYCEFTRRFGGIARSVGIDEPWRSDVVMISGVAVGVASICTAWSSGSFKDEHTRDADKGKLILGERQVRELVAELESSGAALRIALMHHPSSWLCAAEERSLRALLRTEFDLVLHGHDHETAADAVHRPNRGMVEIGAGAAYTRREHPHRHGFWVGWLDADRGRLELDAFTWKDGEGGRWRRDKEFVDEAPDGRLSWVLKLARLGGGASPEAARVGSTLGSTADRLRRAATRVYATYRGFFGFPDSAPKPKATLDDMFVPLHFTRESGVGKQNEEVPLSELEPGWLSPAGESETAARAVILGAPGSGKSTLCRYLAGAAAGREHGPVPLLVTVRSWAADGATEGLLAAAAREAEATLAIRVDVNTLEGLCEAGGAVLLIDGVDEVESHRRAQLRDWVHGFCTTYPRVPVIVTSRIVGYDLAPLDREFSHLRLEPFDDAQLEDFVDRWYEVAVPEDPSERRRRRTALQAALEAEPRAKELARTPLFATLIALVHLHQAHLPGERAKLYHLCIELLVVTWPAERGRTLAELDGQVTRLEDLALSMQRRRGSEFDERNILISGEELERELDALLARHREELDEGRRRSLAGRWRRWLVADSGVLQEFEHDRYGFLHLSLMEYLAGRAVLREYGREGYGAIARFVCELNQEPRWRECLLLMLGSEGNNLGLSTAVVEALLELRPPTWQTLTTCTFLLALLREEVELSASLRAQVLEATSAAALHVPYWWEQPRILLSDILSFSRNPEDAVRKWFDAQLATRAGDELIGVLMIAPDAITPTAEMEARRDDELSSLLDLTPAFPWGRWAHERASDPTLLRWSIRTPIEGILLRALPSALGWSDARPWVAGLVRRAAWFCEVSIAAARALADAGGTRGLPSGLTWRSGDVEHTTLIVPYHGVMGSTASRHLVAFAQHFAHSFALRLFRDTVRNLGFDLTSSIVQDYAHYLTLDLKSVIADGMDEFLVLDLPRRFTFDISPTRAPSSISLDAVSIESIETANQQSELSLTSLAQAAEITPPETSIERIYCWTKQLDLQLAAEALAGLLLSPAFDDPTIPATLAAARIHNRWLNIFLDPLVDHATRESPLTPGQHALFLALGLAQYQTTHAWPSSRHWQAWFSTDTPPDDWLAAHVWHLCRGVDSPDNAEHFALADACLARGDWPELVAELRKYPIRPTPPEILALYDQD